MENNSEESYKNLEEKFDKMRTSFENGTLDIKNVSLEEWMEPWEGLKNFEEENGRLRYAIKNMFHIQNYTSEELKKKCENEDIEGENDRDRKNKLLKAFIAARAKQFGERDNDKMRLVGQTGQARKSRRKSRRKKRRKSRRKKRRKTKRRKKRRKSRRKTRRKTKRRKTKNHK